MTGNPTIDKIILGINGLVIASATALVVYAHTSIKKPLTKRNLKFGTMIEDSMLELQKTPVDMDEIVVNLYSREVKLRFLDTKMSIVLFEDKDREFVMGLKPHLFDSLIDVAGNMSPKELNSVTGRILLETRVKKRVDEIIQRPVVKKILFSKFIIQ